MVQKTRNYHDQIKLWLHLFCQYLTHTCQKCNQLVTQCFNDIWKPLKILFYSNSHLKCKFYRYSNCDLLARLAWCYLYTDNSKIFSSWHCQLKQSSISDTATVMSSQDWATVPIHQSTLSVVELVNFADFLLSFWRFKFWN